MRSFLRTSVVCAFFFGLIGCETDDESVIDEGGAEVEGNALEGTLEDAFGFRVPAIENAISPSVTAYAPAPPLTQMWVYAVGSSNCGWEYTVGLSATLCNHGGTQLRAAVLEIGYGSSLVAWMNAGLLPSSAMYATQTVCVSGSSYNWPCNPGQTVVGFMRYYNLDGNQSGLFKYQNTSTNSPWNTKSVQISVL